MMRACLLGWLLALAVPACATSHGGDEAPQDGSSDEVLCVTRGSRIHPEGCATAEHAFSEAFVAPSECLYTTELQCAQYDGDGEAPRVWLFSGDYIAHMSTRPCDEATRARAVLAPPCKTENCMPCDTDGGDRLNALCGLGPPCP
jgi:hypothetical protein